MPAGAAPGIDVEVADGLLSTTRAVRRRLDLDRPVPLEVIRDCLEVATQAPTGANVQGWRWIVVVDPGTREKLADLYRDAARTMLEKRHEVTRLMFGDAAAPSEDLSAEEMERAYAGVTYMLSVLHRVPVLVVACIEGRIDGAANPIAAGFYGSVLPAVWSFMVALRARGLGSVYTTVHLWREAEVAALRGVPAGVTQVALLPIAYTIGQPWRRAARRPVEDVTYLNSWGNRIAAPPGG